MNVWKQLIAMFKLYAHLNITRAYAMKINSAKIIISKYMLPISYDLWIQ